MIKILSIVTLVLIGCTLLCGFWISANPGKTEAEQISSRRFHMMLGLAVAAAGITLAILGLIGKIGG